MENHKRWKLKQSISFRVPTRNRWLTRIRKFQRFTYKEILYENVEKHKKYRSNLGLIAVEYLPWLSGKGREWCPAFWRLIEETFWKGGVTFVWVTEIAQSNISEREPGGISNLSILSSLLFIFCQGAFLAKPNWKPKVGESIDRIHIHQPSEAGRRVEKDGEWVWRIKEKTSSTHRK